MKFSKDHKVKIETLSKLEAKYYICFLEEENGRHKKEIIHLEGYISMLTIHPLIQFYESAILRHKDDIKDTNTVIESVKERFGL